MIRRRLYRVGLAVASLGSLAWLGSLAGCPGPGGASVITIGVDVEPATVALGSEPGPIVDEADLCVRLPILLGSSVEKHERLSGVEVKIAATRDAVDVEFPGSGERRRSYSIAQLLNGFSDTLSLSASGEAMVVTIASGCTNP